MDEMIILVRKLNELELRNDDRSIKEGALKLSSFSFLSTLVTVAVVGTACFQQLLEIDILADRSVK